MSIRIEKLADDLLEEIARVEKTLMSACRDCAYYARALKESEQDRDNAYAYRSYLKSSLEKIRELESNLYG